MALPSENHSEPRPSLRRARDPRLPQPSWHQAIGGDEQASGRNFNAGEFWARLGI